MVKRKNKQVSRENHIIRGPLYYAFLRFLSNKAALISGVILSIIILMSIFAPLITSTGYEEQKFLTNNLAFPSWSHWFGIDDLGRDFYTRIIYGARVSQMGEESWRICICGDPGLDNLYRQPTMTFEELQKDLEMNLLNPTALVTFHPVTLELDELKSQLEELFKALEAATIDYEMQYLITFPNADAGSSYITQEWKKFIKNKPGRRLVKSLGQTRYLSALNYLSMMIGNSSSGLVEAPSFSMPVINIGNRQQGRLKGKNIFDVGHSSAEIIKGIDQALSWDRNISCINPFGNGNSSSKILKHLQYVFTNFDLKKILSKKFINTREVEEAEIKLKVELKK